MPPGPPKLFRTWPTVASPQAQKRLDDDAEMMMWLMGLPRRGKAGEGEDKTPEGIWEPQPQQGWEPPPQAHFPTSAAYPGLFQGLLYKPPGARGLLDLDPHEPPTPAPAPAWPAPGASSSAAQFLNTFRLAAETDMRPATLSLSNPGSLPPEPAPQPQPKTYMQGGAGADWRDEFSGSALDKPASPFGDAAMDRVEPRRSAPVFNPPPGKQELPGFRAPVIPAPTAPRSRARDNTAMDQPMAGAVGKADDLSLDEQARKVIRNSMRLEGGLVNDPNDPGGVTNHGISYEKFGKLIGLSRQEVENMAPERAEGIYREHFYDKYGIGRLPSEFQPQVFDYLISSGSDGTGLTAFKDLQRTLNDLKYTDAEGKKLDEDGILGSRTVQAATKAAQSGAALIDLNNALLERRKAYYESIVAKDKTQEVHQLGWLRRAESFKMKHK